MGKHHLLANQHQQSKVGQLCVCSFGVKMSDKLRRLTTSMPCAHIQPQAVQSDVSPREAPKRNCQQSR